MNSKSSSRFTSPDGNAHPSPKRPILYNGQQIGPISLPVSLPVLIMIKHFLQSWKQKSLRSVHGKDCNTIEVGLVHSLLFCCRYEFSVHKSMLEVSKAAIPSRAFESIFDTANRKDKRELAQELYYKHYR
jgi:hypothetical protein